MKTALLKNPQNENRDDYVQSTDLVKQAFSTIAPFWPLENLIAVNPLQGLEGLPFEEALKQGAAYFRQETLPAGIEAINRETIKWMQAYLDDGQSTISMPLRGQGLYAAWRQLAVYDRNLHADDAAKFAWLSHLPESPEQAMSEAFLRLSIPKEERVSFLTLLLTTLPGWAAHVKYRTEWKPATTRHAADIAQQDYLAVRLVMTVLLWPQAKEILEWHKQALQNDQTSLLEAIQKAETAYRLPLLEKLAAQKPVPSRTPDAQLVFCIDVRSEPFRRALESTGNYQTFGFAGFFGVPVQLTDATTGETYASCPVLLKPAHDILQSPCTPDACDNDKKGYARKVGLKRIYQSLKYAFTSPFILVDALGPLAGLWMALRGLSPALAARLKVSAAHALRSPQAVMPHLSGIPLAQQAVYAEGALRMMGLTRQFAPLVIFCGHGSTTENNPYATALDCGACGGRHGAGNARILAAMLNDVAVRKILSAKGIDIPDTTRFVAAEHDTTTDDIRIEGDIPPSQRAVLSFDLEAARAINSAARLKNMGMQTVADSQGKAATRRRAADWAEVRPEWGLARNAAFIVAPRDITAPLDLQGRCFLHSYDYRQDTDGAALTVILTAPMVVAEWINTQYLFSAIDNVAFGGGSKVTCNVTGKLGVMQGNASDLMTGLPLQSVHADDHTPYHEPQRLMCVVYAPRNMIEKIVAAQPVLQKLFGNGWVQLVCIDPEAGKTFFMTRKLGWENVG